MLFFPVLKTDESLVLICGVTGTSNSTLSFLQLLYFWGELSTYPAFRIHNKMCSFFHRNKVFQLPAHGAPTMTWTFIQLFFPFTQQFQATPRHHSCSHLSKASVRVPWE